MKFLGIVKWFNHEEGYGVIGTPEDGDIFLHHTNLNGITTEISKGTALIFETQKEKRKRTGLIFETQKEKRKVNAVNVHEPKSYEDFSFILSYLSKPRTVMIDETFQRKQTLYNIYFKADKQSNDIVFLSLHEQFKGQPLNTVLEIFKQYFDLNFIKSDSDEFLKFLKVFKELTTKIEIDFSEERVSDLINYFLEKIGNKPLFTVWKQNLHIIETKSDHFFVRNLLPIHRRNISQTEEKKNQFNFPESAFLDNYLIIDSNDLGRICKLNNGIQLGANIIQRKINSLASINNHDFEQIVLSIALILEKELREEIKQQFADKLLILLLQSNFSGETKEETENFRLVIDTLKTKIGHPYDENIIRKFNESLLAGCMFNLWQKTRYFIPSVEFFRQNYSRLTYDDFINGNETFHYEYFFEKYTKLGEVKDIKTFGLLVCLLVETPIPVISSIIRNLPLPFQLALWISFPREKAFLDKYYEADYKTADISIEEDKIIDYLSQLVLIDEILNSLSIVKRIQERFSSKTNRYSDAKGFRNLDYQERELLVSEELLEQDIQVIDFLKLALKRVEQSSSLFLIKSIIPKFVNEGNVQLNQLIELLQEVELQGNIQQQIFDYISQTTSRSNRVFLWYKGYSTAININEIIEEFNKFPKDEQSKLLRKIFLLVKTNNVSSIDYFTECLIKISDKENIDIDVRICLEVISSLKSSNSYVGEKIISEIICKYVDEDLNEIIQINDLFEKCNGRTWMTPGESQRSWHLNIEGKEFPVEDDNVIIGDRYFAFDKATRSVMIDGTNYNFSWSKKEHNVFSKLYERPSGITYCDAVKSQYEEGLSRHFYWCCNGKCYAPCQNDHIHLEWQQYSLRDFIKILNLPFVDDQYYRFVSVVNRANRLLKKLQCSSCKKLLRDSQTSQFAFYRVTTFHCTNPDCMEFHNVIYLNHCFNWKCLNVVDSRISKMCPNGWYICDKCNNCCSQEKIDRRYENLLENKAFFPNNPRHQKLKYQVDNKLGHLERNLKYSYKTGNLLENEETPSVKPST